MPRGLDHIVHAVRDLDAARKLYQRLGFTVGARNRHPRSWGTENHIVQFPGCFVELLAIGDATEIAPHGARSFSFGAFNREFLARNEGLSMLALESTNAAADAKAFRTAAIGDFDVFDFQREACRPDGTPVKVAFSLAFARDEDAPNIAFFTCQQHYPENFWNPAFQRHPNTTDTIAEVVLVADNPSDHHVFLSAFVGERDLAATSSGIRIRTPRGDVQIMDPVSFGNHFAIQPPDVSNGARLAAVCFDVRDPAITVAALSEANLTPAPHMGRIVVAPSIAMGAALVFDIDRADGR